MKPILEVTLQEWALTRDKLLDTFVEKTAEVDYPSWFMAKVWHELNLDISQRKPCHPDSLDSVLWEINAIRSIIEDIDDFLFEEVDGKTRLVRRVIRRVRSLLRGHLSRRRSETLFVGDR